MVVGFAEAKSVWLIESQSRASDIRDAIDRNLDSNDGLLVVKANAPGGAWRGLSTEVSDWLMKHLT